MLIPPALQGGVSAAYLIIKNDRGILIPPSKVISRFARDGILYFCLLPNIQVHPQYRLVPEVPTKQ